MTTTENVRAHLAPEAGEGASAYVDPLDIGDAILEVYDDHEPRIASLEASGNVGTSDLADSAVTTAKIADSAVTSAKIADSAVTSAKIADGTIVTGDLADSAVTSAKIADGTIATGDLADSAVTSAKIAAGTIVSSDLATSAVATSNIADSAVTSAKIADGTIVNADVAPAAAIDVSKLSGAVASATVGNLLASAAANCTGGLSLYKYTAAYGSESVTVTATDTVAGWVYNTGTVSVTAGKTYTFRVDVTASSGRDWRLSVQWRTGGSNIGGLVSSQVLGVGATGTLSQSIVAPAGADNVYCNIYSGSGSIGDTATFSKFGIWEGAGGAWCEPGRVVTGLQPQLSVSSVSSAVTASAAQPVLSVSGTTTVTIPLAANNSGVKFTVINSGTGTVTVSRSGSDTISGLTSFTIPGKGQVEIISDGSAWLVLGGSYTTDAAGLATYAWDAVSAGWRLVAYDSGWRDVSSLLVNSWAASGTDGRVEARRTRDTIQAVLNLSAAAKTANTVLTLPAGFRPPRNEYGIPGQEGLSGAYFGAYLSNAGVFAAYTTSAQAYLTVNVPASSTLPSSLPGTTVTAPY